MNSFFATDVEIHKALYLKLISRELVQLTPLQKNMFEKLNLELQYVDSDHYILINPDLYYRPYNILFLEKLYKHVRDIQVPFLTSSTLDFINIQKQEPVKLIIADGQYKGKGQYDRVWQSALGRQIQMTFGPWPYKNKVSPSLWVAYVALTTLFSFHADMPLLFKWPNDLYLGDKKLGGFLLLQQDDRCVISLGLNITFSSVMRGFDSLYSFFKIDSREIFINAFLSKVTEPIPDSAIILNFLMKHSFFYSGQAVIVTTCDQKFSAEARFIGLNTDGSCSIARNSLKTPQSFYSGSIKPIHQL